MVASVSTILFFFALIVGHIRTLNQTLKAALNLDESSSSEKYVTS